jgi:hypothetical protein
MGTEVLIAPAVLLVAYQTLAIQEDEKARGASPIGMMPCPGQRSESSNLCLRQKRDATTRRGGLRPSRFLKAIVQLLAPRKTRRHPFSSNCCSFSEYVFNFRQFYKSATLSTAFGILFLSLQTCWPLGICRMASAISSAFYGAGTSNTSFGRSPCMKICGCMFTR